MVRPLTGNTAEKSQEVFGTEPITIVEIDWEGSVNKVKYSDRDVSEGGIISEGRILKMGPIRSSIGPRQLGSSTSVKVTLIDNDLSIRNILNTNRAEDKDVRIFQFFAGLTSTDLVTLIRGKVGSPVSYDEQEREFSFNIVGAINSKPIGNVIETPTVANPEGTKGKSWPVCFGKVKEVPALLYKRFPKASIKEKVGLFGPATFEVELLGSDKKAGDVYPVGATTWIFGGEIVFGGFSSGSDSFLFVGTFPRNLNRYSFGTGSRVPGLDFFNPHVLWMSFFSDLVNGNINVTDHWINVAGVLNYCIGQEGTKLYFQNPFSILVPSAFNCTVRKFEPETKTQFDGNGNVIGTFVNGHIHEPGTVMELYNNNDSAHEYIINQLVTTQVVEVKAFRKIEGAREPQLTCIPDDYYEEEFTTIENGKTATTLSFKIPLSQRDEGWTDDNIFVSLTSSVGRNTADQIKFILENFTDLEIDTVSFTSVAAKLTNFPSDFAILDGSDAIQTCNNMAWQARCALYTVGNKAFIKFLPEDPVGTEIDNVSISPSITDEESSFILGSTPIDQLVTVLKLTWKPAYSEDDIEARFSVNTSVFGERKDERTVFIYQNEIFVEKTGDFWIQRLGRIWRTISGRVFLDALPAELLDYVEVNYPDLVTPAPVVGQITATDHNTKDNTIGFDVWLPIEAGTNVLSANAYQDNSGGSIEDPFDQIQACTIEKFFIGRKPEFIIGKRDAIRSVAPATIDSLVSGIGGNTGIYFAKIYPNGLTSLPTELVMVTDVNATSDLSVGDNTMIFQSESGQYFLDSTGATTPDPPVLDTLFIDQTLYPFKAYEDVNFPGQAIQPLSVVHWPWMFQGETLFVEATAFAQPFVRSYMVRVYLDTTVEFQGGAVSGTGRTRFVDIKVRQHPQNITEEMPNGTVVWVMAIRTQGAGLQGNDPVFINDDWSFVMLSPVFLA